MLIKSTSVLESNILYSPRLQLEIRFLKIPQLIQSLKKLKSEEIKNSVDPKNQIEVEFTGTDAIVSLSIAAATLELRGMLLKTNEAKSASLTLIMTPLILK